MVERRLRYAYLATNPASVRIGNFGQRTKWLSLKSKQLRKFTVLYVRLRESENRQMAQNSVYHMQRTFLVSFGYQLHALSQKRPRILECPNDPIGNQKDSLPRIRARTGCATRQEATHSCVTV